MSEFAGTLFLPEDARGDWQQLMQQSRHLRWTTQHSIRVEGRARYPDIVLFDGEDELPLLLIENKIGHHITEYTDIIYEDAAERKSNEGEAEVANQLSDYGKWLALHSKGRRWPGAIALLTHFTPPPADFARGDSNRYGIRFQHVCRWHELKSRPRNLFGSAGSGRLEASFRRTSRISQGGGYELRDDNL